MKKILFSLLCLIGLSSFCGAELIGSFTCSNPSSEPCGQSYIYFPPNCTSVSIYLQSDYPFSLERYKIDGTVSSTPKSTTNLYTFDCSEFNKIQIKSPPGWVSPTPSYPYIVSYGTDPNGGSCPECPTCSSQYTSEECQSVYGLVSSGVLNSCQSSLSGCQLDLNSCQSSLSGWDNTLNNCSNNLLSCESSLASCIQSNCPIDTGSVMWSSIWINGIQHLGKPVINIDIPDQIYWQYTTDDEEFNLYVGSGYDQEYIDNVIAINSYHPTSEDFTSVFVGGLTLIMPYIFIALLILFIRKLVKRIFK